MVVDFNLQSPDSLIEHPGATYLTHKFDAKEEDLDIDHLQKTVSRTKLNLKFKLIFPDYQCYCSYVAVFGEVI